MWVAASDCYWYCPIGYLRVHALGSRIGPGGLRLERSPGQGLVVENVANLVPYQINSPPHVGYLSLVPDQIIHRSRLHKLMTSPGEATLENK